MMMSHVQVPCPVAVAAAVVLYILDSLLPGVAVKISYTVKKLHTAR